MKYTTLKYAGPVALATLLASSTIGCGVSKEEIQKAIIENNSQIEKNYVPRTEYNLLEQRLQNTRTDVESIRTKTHIGIPILRGDGFTNEYGQRVGVYDLLSGILSNNFKDPVSREDVRERSNMIVLHTTNDDNFYYGMVMVDTDKSGSPSRGDRVISDGGREENEKMIPLSRDEIPTKVLEWLINMEHIRK